MKELNTTVVGKAIKSLRDSKGWSLEYEAQLIGINRNSLSNYESDADNMPFSIFKKILLLHNISTNIFFTKIYDNSLILISETQTKEEE